MTGEWWWMIASAAFSGLLEIKHRFTPYGGEKTSLNRVLF